MSDLSRLLKAQETDYKRALSEIRSGHEVAPETEVFQKVLDKFFEGKPDQRTIELL